MAAPEEVQFILTTMAIKDKSISCPAWRPSLKDEQDPRNTDNWEILLGETQSADIQPERPFSMANGAHHVIKLLRKSAIKNPLPTRVWTIEAPNQATLAGAQKDHILQLLSIRAAYIFRKPRHRCCSGALVFRSIVQKCTRYRYIFTIVANN